MKHLFMALFLVANLTSFAQQVAIPKNDPYTAKGSHGINFTGNLSGGNAVFQSYSYKSFNMNNRLSYEYFIKNAWSLGGDVLTDATFNKYQWGGTFSRLNMNVGLHSRYYFGLGKSIPYRWLFVEGNIRTAPKLINFATGKSFNTVAFGGRIGANVQLHNSWFLDLSVGHYRFLDNYRQGGNFDAMVGLSYRFSHKK